MKTSWLSVLAAVLLCLPSHVAQADESGAETKVSRLRLFNTDVFGKSAEEAVVLLRPARKTQIDRKRATNSILTAVLTSGFRRFFDPWR
jgi:hypothetical protein